MQKHNNYAIFPSATIEEQKQNQINLRLTAIVNIITEKKYTCNVQYNVKATFITNNFL